MLIEIFSDLICPWCYIGMKRLERAIAGHNAALATQIEWHPFQLNPAMPEGGMDRARYVAAKFGGPRQAEGVLDHIRETALRDGIAINLDRISRTPNTMAAHRIVRLAARDGLASQMTARLFEAYFVEGLDIGAHDCLVQLGRDTGLEGDLNAFLAGSEEEAAVRAGNVAARRIGVNAVPCFVIEGRCSLSGAQEAEAFWPLFDIVATSRRQTSGAAHGGADFDSAHSSPVRQ